MVPISLLLQRCYLKILIDDSFSVEEISELLCISERTLFRRMLKYDLHTIDVSKITVNQFDSDVLSHINEFSFCCETMLRELLKGRGTNDQGIDVGLYHELFNFMVYNTIIDPLNEVHLAALHFIFISLMNENCMHDSMLGQSIGYAQSKLRLYVSG